jgi:hypothetical protein
MSAETGRGGGGALPRRYRSHASDDSVAPWRYEAIGKSAKIGSAAALSAWLRIHSCTRAKRDAA